MGIRISVPVFVAAFSLLALPALADDWVAEKLRGKVFAFDGEDWVQLQRGDVISDDREIRTLLSGRVMFVRGEESIVIGGDSQISIEDRAGQKYTVVHQTMGKISVEAEKRNVRHFEVQTPFLAAVVKGTQFVVEVNSSNAAVSVGRGSVNAVDRGHGLMVDIAPGQTASSGAASVLSVTGAGSAEITSLSGQKVTQDQIAQMQAAVSSANGSGNSNGNSGGNSGSAPGNSGNAPGQSGSAPGNSGNSNAGGNGNGNGNAGANSGNSNAGGNGNGNGNAGGNSNAGGNGNGNAGGNGNGNGNGNSDV